MRPHRHLITSRWPSLRLVTPQYVSLHLVMSRYTSLRLGGSHLCVTPLLPPHWRGRPTTVASNSRAPAAAPWRVARWRASRRASGGAVCVRGLRETRCWRERRVGWCGADLWLCRAACAPESAPAVPVESGARGRATMFVCRFLCRPRADVPFRISAFAVLCVADRGWCCWTVRSRCLAGASTEGDARQRPG
jgi:hypothetical protein